MTTMYHATTVENAESIMENGFWLYSNDESAFDREVEEQCVYMMDNQADAENFAADNFSHSIAIVKIEVADDQDLMIDPEYDGEAFYMTEEPKAVEMIVIQEL